MEETASASPRARITGVVYLLYFACAITADSLLKRKIVIYGNTINIVADLLYIVLTLLLYRLLRPVNRSLSLVATSLSLAGCAVTIIGQVRVTHHAMNPLIFFGPFCILLGSLILRSTFLPHPLGVLLLLSGVAWLIFLIPSLPRLVPTGIQALGILAEASLMLWLLVRGVDAGRWREQRLEGRG